MALKRASTDAASSFWLEVVDLGAEAEGAGAGALGVILVSWDKRSMAAMRARTDAASSFWLGADALRGGDDGVLATGAGVAALDGGALLTEVSTDLTAEAHWRYLAISSSGVTYVDAA
jgi:hypothetical protein